MARMKVKGRLTKHGALKMLKRMTRGNPRWVLSPHRVYTSPEQFRIEHVGDKTRLLIRTDEVGKRYEHLEWRAMPIEELDLREYPSARPKKELEAHIQGKLSEVISRVPKHSWRDAKIATQSQLIVHPTRDRGEIGLFGNVETVVPDEPIHSALQLNVKLNPKPIQTHSMAGISFDHSFRFGLKKTNRGFSITGLQDFRQQTRDQPEVRKLGNSVMRFMRKAMNEGNLDPDSAPTVHFLKWKTAGKLEPEIEFYDIRQFV